jgi:acyl-CoA dehydrogenase
MTAADIPALRHASGPPPPAAALEAIGGAHEVLTSEAVRADRTSTFPEASIGALRRLALLSAGIPAAYGGGGYPPDALVPVAAKLASFCGSTAMIWAMHQIQVACLARCAPDEPAIAAYLRAAACEQHLIASVTSEAGIGGNLRRSKAALVPAAGSLLALEKHATTVSYAERADSFLITARRDEQAAPADQVLVLARADQVRLERTGDWNMLGMRGTCSPGFVVRAAVPASHVLPEPFGTIAGRCMVPLSHLLWAAVWTGIATDAVRRATSFSRVKMRSAARSGTAAPDPRLGQMYTGLAGIRDSLHQFAGAYTRWEEAADGDDTGMTIRANALKMSVSTAAVRVAELALEVCGMAGYSEEGPYSVARHLRDLYSARLMISNSTLNGVTSELLLLREVELH